MLRTCISIRTLQLAALAGVCFAGTAALAQIKSPGVSSKLRPLAKQVVQKAKLPATATMAQMADNSPAAVPGNPGPAPRGPGGACVIPGGGGCQMVPDAATCAALFGTFQGPGSSCPVADCGFAVSFTNCQDFEYPRVGGTSFLSMGSANVQTQVIAEDFKTDGAGTHNLTELCWWGAYTVRATNAAFFPCGTSTPPTTDAFQVKIFEMTLGVPDATLQVGPTLNQGVNMTVTRRDFCDSARQTHEFHATLSAPLALQPNHCYAIEIGNNTTDNTINYFWSHAAAPSVNNQAWSRTGTANYDGSAGLIVGDRAFCMNVGLTIFQSPLCSAPPPPICTNPDSNGQVRNGINFGGFSCLGPGAVGLQLGDSVQFSSSGAISNVCFWGFWVAPDNTQPTGPSTPDFNFTIMESDGTDGLPNTVLLDGRCGTTANFNSFRNGGNYRIEFPAFNVTAGHCYYFSIAFPQDNTDPNHAFRFAWGLAADPPLNPMSNNQAISRPGTTGGAYNFFSFGTDPAAPSNMSWTFSLPAVLPSCGLPPPPPPPPGNDNCSAATAINGVGTYPYDNRGATTDVSVPAPSCDPTSGRDCWFNWTAPCGGDFTISLCAGASTDTILTAYDGGTCVGTELACSDDDCGVGGGPSIVTISATGGNHYMVRVGTFGGSTGQQGSFDISRNGGACPPNCPCDFNHNGTLNSQDFFDFLACFFTTGCPNADYNNSGQVNSQDFFDFLTCFFAPPASCFP